MKIFVYGFPHSGTTILRKLIGEHSLIHDWIDEYIDPPKIDNVVYKMPILPGRKQKDCKRIMIMKNPYDIFGSFYLRFGVRYLTYPGRGIKDYERFIEYFLTTTDFTIKYEDISTRLPEVFKYLGLEFEGIKNNQSYIGEEWKDVPKKKPTRQDDGDDHALYRSWQINQPFRDMTGESAKHLPWSGRELISKSEIIKRVYG